MRMRTIPYRQCRHYFRRGCITQINGVTDVLTVIIYKQRLLKESVQHYAAFIPAFVQLRSVESRAQPEISLKHCFEQYT
jgi:hypothetical protein